MPSDIHARDLIVEDEEATDSLSPSDGYFNNGSAVPRNLFIPDPSQSHDSNGKYREADIEQQNGSGSLEGSRQIIYTPATSSEGSVGHRYADEDFIEHSPLLPDAPPGYEAATAGRQPYRPESVASEREAPASPTRNYASINNVSEPNIFETQAPFSSMKDLQVGPEVEEARPPRWRQAWGKRKDRRSRCCRVGCCRDGTSIRRMLMFLLAAFLGLWLIGSLIHKVRKHHHKSANPPSFSDPDNTMPPEEGPHRSSRELYIHETSNSVSGTYALYDLLSIRTLSGSVSINVEPKEADPDHPSRPARLVVSSTSGSVRIQFPSSSLSDGIPSREYQISVETMSGTITGTYVHGSKTELGTKSGSISCDILPVYPNDGHDDYESQLATSTFSGSTRLNVLNPLNGEKLANLTAHHHCRGSGSMNIKYPARWQGRVEARSGGSGSVQMGGDHLDVERRGSKLLVGQKGRGNRKVLVDTVGSGSVQFWAA